MLKFIVCLLLFIISPIFAVTSFAHTGKLSTDPHYAVVYYLSTDPTKDTIPIVNNHKNINQTTIYSYSTSKKNIGDDPEPVAPTANAPLGVANAPGACVSFVMSPTTENKTLLYNHCTFPTTKIYNYDKNGKLSWYSYREVTVDWTTPPRKVEVYIIPNSVGKNFLETNRTGGSIIGDIANDDRYSVSGCDSDRFKPCILVKTV